MNKHKIDEAFKSYNEGKISMGKAAEVANLTIWKFLDLLKERKIPIRQDSNDIKNEIGRIVKEDVEWGLKGK